MARKPTCKELEDRLKELERELDVCVASREAAYGRERKYERIFDNMTDVYYRADLGGQLLDVSPSGPKLLGYDRAEEMIGKDIAANFYADPKQREYLRTQITRKGKIAFEGTLKRKDGTLLVAETRSWLVCDEAGSPVGIEGIFRDVSRRLFAEKALRTSEEKFRDIYEESPIGIEIYDGEGRLVDVNKACLKIFGVTDVEGVRGFDLFKDPNVSDEVKARLKMGETVRYAFPFDFARVKEHALYETKRSGIIYLDVMITPLGAKEAGSAKGYLVQVQDVTEAKRAQEALYAAHDFLERRVEERTAELVRLNERLKAEIDERQQAEKALRESEKKYRDLVDNSLVGIYRSNVQGDFLYANEALARMLEFESPKEMMAGGVLATYKEHSDRSVLIESLKKSGKVNNFELELVTRRGRIKDVLCSAVLEGETISGMLMDITERKRAERALRESEEKYRGLFENSTDFAYTLDRKGNFTKVNQTAERLTGFTKAELIGMNYADYVPSRSQKGLSQAFARIFKTGEPLQDYPLEVIVKDGSNKYFETSASLLWERGKVVGLQGSSRDITERKVAEDALRESEEKFRSLAEKSPNMIFINKRGRVVYANRRCEEVMGYRRQEFYSPDFDFRLLIAPESIETVEAAFAKHMKGEEVDPYEYALITKDGRRIEVIIAPKLIPFEKENAILGVITDITERKWAEEALRKSEEQYRDLFENANDLIQSVAPDGRFLQVNQKWHETLGYSEQELADLTIWDVIHPDSVPHCKELFQSVLTGKPVSLMETIFVSKNGDPIPVEGNANARFENGTPVATRGIFRDISERKRVEEETKRLRLQLERAQRLETIGTLAGGIAHDFNNLLMGIQGNVSLMLMDTPSTYPHHQRLGSIEHLVHSGAKLTAHLLGYARKGKYDIRPIDLNKMIRDTLETFGRTRKDVAIHHELAKNLFPIEADYAQMEQVLLNLFVNAGDAMPDGGELVLKTVNVTHEDMKGKLYDPKYGKYVLLMVTDTGMGMDRETTERIFDPFFTTKEMGRGTGLGLASAYGIIKAHGGYLDVESRKGKGTTFSIYLPASEKRIQEAVKTVERAAKGAGTVLLVDDEEVVLEVSRDLLEAMGYHVLTARDAKQAIEVYKESQDDIDIVVLDMVMPQVGGGEVYDHMKRINSEVKVLLSSGFSIDGEATQILERGCNGFIQKPFNAEQLSSKIRQVLGK